MGGLADPVGVNHERMTKAVLEQIDRDFLGGVTALTDWKNQEIMLANADTDEDQFHSNLHCDGENINGCQKRIFDLVARIRRRLADPYHRFDRCVLLGKYGIPRYPVTMECNPHGSRRGPARIYRVPRTSNWIELGHDTDHPVFGHPADLCVASGLGIAVANGNTCANCGTGDSCVWVPPPVGTNAQLSQQRQPHDQRAHERVLLGRRSAEARREVFSRRCLRSHGALPAGRSTRTTDSALGRLTTFCITRRCQPRKSRATNSSRRTSWIARPGWSRCSWEVPRHSTGGVGGGRYRRR